MKKVIIILNLFFVLLLCSCKFNLINNKIKINQNHTCNSNVSNKISELKKAGLLDNLLLDCKNARTSEANCINEFINNTDKVLEQISESENGSEEIAVINALFGESTINDFAATFSRINPEKSQELLEYINENLSLSENESARSISNNQTVRLLYASDIKCSDRAAYAKDLEWSTIGWYTGFCASTIAGFYLASYGGFWSKIAGLVAAAASSASMVYQLIKWSECSDLDIFVKKLVGKNLQEAADIINTEDGTKILTITTETVATVTACYFTPFGKSLVSKIIYYHNLIMEKIIAVLPKGINFTINNIPIKLIK